MDVLSEWSLVGVEGVHQNEGDVGVVLLVQVLYLLHRYVQEGELVPHLDQGTLTQGGGTITRNND